VNDLKNRKSEFRPFYQEIVDDILGNMKRIIAFANKKRNTRSKKGCFMSKTRKIMGG
jgi:hypothetical protein